MVLKVGQTYGLKTKNLDNIAVYIESMDEECIYLNELVKMDSEYVSVDYILEKNTNSYKLSKLSGVSKIPNLEKLSI